MDQQRLKFRARIAAVNYPTHLGGDEIRTIIENLPTSEPDYQEALKLSSWIEQSMRVKVFYADCPDQPVVTFLGTIPRERTSVVAGATVRITIQTMVAFKDQIVEMMRRRMLPFEIELETGMEIQLEMMAAETNSLLPPKDDAN